MKRTPTYLFFFILWGFLLPNNGSAQEVEFGFNVDYGNFKMESFRNYQDYVQGASLSGITPKINDDFPAFFNYGISVGWLFSNGKAIGIKLGYQSTGGKTSYSDYSGDFLSEQLMSSTKMSFYGRTSLKSNPNLSFSVELGAMRSYLDLTESFRILDFQESTNFNLESDGLFSSMDIGYSISINEFFITPSLGYEFNFTNQVFHLKDNVDAKLELPTSDEAKPDWSGWRIGIEMKIKI